MKTGFLNFGIAAVIVGMATLTAVGAQDKLDKPKQIVRLNGIELAFSTGDTIKLKLLAAKFDSVAEQCRRQSEFCNDLLRFHRISGVAVK